MYETIYEQRITADAPLPFELPQWIALAPFEEYLGMHIDEAKDGRLSFPCPFARPTARARG